MKDSKKLRIKMGLYVLFLAVISVSIILMPFTVDDYAIIPIWVSGLLFWLGFVGVIVTVMMINKIRKKDTSFRKKRRRLKQLGLTHFFQNKPAVVFDLIMFGSIISFILISLMVNIKLFQFICLSIFVFSFGMHCMLNGVNYIYINYTVRSSVSK